MAKKVTTLFIRDTNINLLVMNGRQVEKWASLPLEPGLVRQGLILDEAQVADKIRYIFQETGAKTDKVIIGISGHDSLYRIITLPRLPEAILPEAIKREAKRTIPTPLEDVYFSYQPLPSSTTGEYRIFLVTFPRNLVDALVKTLRQAGVRPYIMDLAPLAMCRIPNEPRAIIVNARLDHLDVIVLADRLPQVIRRLSLPGEAESLEERLPLITEEFNRTVSFYNSSHIEKPLDSTVPVFVSGDLAEVPETWPSAIGANYPVSSLSSPVESPEGFNPNEFMINIGLALKELLPAKEDANFSIVNFNALPEAYLPEHVSITRILIPVGIVIGIGLIILGVILIQHNRTEIAALQSQVEETQFRVAQLQQEIKTLTTQVGSVGATADELNTRIATMERDRAVVYEDLTQIVRLAAEKVNLGSVTHGGETVTITGGASNEDDIFSYARDLRQSGRFSGIWINSISSGEVGFGFALSLTK